MADVLDRGVGGGGIG